MNDEGSELKSAEVMDIPAATGWKEPAHPSAQVVARESLAAMDRLLGQLGGLDEKASYLGAGVVVLIAGFIAGVVARPPSNPHVQDLMVLAFALYLVAFCAVGLAWWPRVVDVPPHPRGLREHHFNDLEVNVLQAITDRVVTSFDETKRVAARKSLSIKVGLVSLILAIATSLVVVAASLLQGGSH